MRAKRYFTPSPSELVKSDTLSTRKSVIVPSKVELGVKDIQFVLVATKYTSLRPLASVELVTPQIEAVHVQAVKVTVHVI